MPRGRPSGTWRLWDELDALDLYETWFVPHGNLPDVAVQSLAKMYNRRAREFIMRSMLVNDGVLFIAVARDPHRVPVDKYSGWIK